MEKCNCRSISSEVKIVSATGIESMAKGEPGRNDPCFCGSGKKYKNCHINHRPREDHIYFAIPAEWVDARTDGKVSVKFHEGKLSAPRPDGVWETLDHVHTQKGYIKEKGGFKALNSIPGIATRDSFKALLENFDYIWAVDTNTRVINGDRVSIGPTLQVPVGSIDATRTATGYKASCDYGMDVTIGFKNGPEKDEEKLSWSKLVQRITTTDAYNTSLRMAIVTDHDRGNHVAYNNRQLPIFRDLFLPKNFTFLYASSDGGGDEFLNRLIYTCDSEARKILTDLSAKGVAEINCQSVSLDQIADISLME